MIEKDLRTLANIHIPENLHVNVDIFVLGTCLKLAL